jgi:hypothetical protein
MQGFLYAKPLPIGEFEAFVRANRVRSDDWQERVPKLAG